VKAAELDEKEKQLEEERKPQKEKEKQLEEKEIQLEKKDKQLDEKDKEIERLKAQLKDIDLFQNGLDFDFIKNYEKKIKAGMIEPWVEKINDPEKFNIEVIPAERAQEYNDLISQRLYLQARNLVMNLNLRNFSGLTKD